MKAIAGLALAAVVLSSVGCVAQSEADDYLKAYRTSEAQNVELQARLDEANSTILALQAEPKEDLEAKAAFEAALAERAKLQAALDEAKERILDLANTRTAPLPTALSDKLEELASQNPALMSYDKKSGMVRLASDLTFSLGSSKVSNEAKSALARLASVLNSTEAMSYEVRVVGHTDNVPMKNKLNISRYGDNWGLSTARAHSVEKALAKSGIAPARMCIAGYGEYRPIAANGIKGSQTNRRVEIYLVVMQKPVAATPSRVAAPVVKSAPSAPAPVTKKDNPVFYK